MEVAGLVLGAVSVVTAWDTCVQAFEIIASGRRFGYEYEVIRVKLEVERVRLLTWGEEVGLANVREGEPHPDGIIDTRLSREEIRDTALRLLGCIQRLFNDTAALQRKYGMRMAPDSDEDHFPIPLASNDGGQFILGPVFRRAYASLQKSSRNHQRNTPLKRKVTWAIGDKTKFLALITEIKGFNDSLVSLFPDVTSRTNRMLQEDIDTSEEIRSLQLLQQATSDDHEEISETASLRLNNLGATLLSDDKSKVVKAAQPADQSKPEEQSLSDTEETQLNELEKELQIAEDFCHKKTLGALTCTVYTQDWSAHCSTGVYWNTDQKGEYSDRFWDDRLKGFVSSPHTSFGR